MLWQARALAILGRYRIKAKEQGTSEPALLTKPKGMNYGEGLQWNCPHVKHCCSTYENIWSWAEQRWSSQYYLFRPWVNSRYHGRESLPCDTFAQYLLMMQCVSLPISLAVHCKRNVYMAPPANCVSYKACASPNWTHVLNLNCNRMTWNCRLAVGTFSIPIAPKSEEKDDCGVLETCNHSILLWKFYIFKALN